MLVLKAVGPVASLPLLLGRKGARPRGWAVFTVFEDIYIEIFKFLETKLLHLNGAESFPMFPWSLAGWVCGHVCWPCHVP